MLTLVLTGGIGDCLLATPFLRHFRLSGKHGPIRCALHREAAPLLTGNPNVDLVIPCNGEELPFWALPEKKGAVFAPYVAVRQAGMGIDTVKQRDLLCLNQGVGSVVSQVARHHGIELADDHLEVFPPPEDLAWATGFLERLQPGPPHRPVVIINRRTKIRNKLYPERHWDEVLARLSPDTILVELAGSGPPVQREHCLAISPILTRSMALIRLADLVLTVDSLPGHLAAATGTPAVVIFGPSNPAVFGHPENLNLRREGCPCCADSPREDRCQSVRCLEELEPELVVTAVHRLLEAGNPPLDVGLRGDAR